MRPGAAVAVALTLGICVPAASSRAAVDWTKLKYFDYESQHLVVATDSAWKGGRVVKTFPNQEILDISGPGLRRTNPKWFWATTCGSSAQFVSFTREIRAPGDPSEGLLNFTIGFGRDLPFRSGTFLVNGTEAARVVFPAGRFSGFPQQFSAPLTAKARNAFNYGTNTLTIRVERKALAKGLKCNSTNRLVAVYATLALRFRPDLVAVPSQKGAVQAIRASPGVTTGALGTITFKSLGPSGSVGGKFFFNWTADGVVETAFNRSSFNLNAPFLSCKGEGLNTGTIECDYADWQVGRVASIGVISPVRPTSRFTPTASASLNMSWQVVPVGGDVKAVNNSTTHQIVLCGSANKEPRCANAK